jgi:SAM-dependent methyltransferase
MSAGYHDSRLAPDPRRDLVWKTLCTHYFSRIVPVEGCVLDLGAGYGSFINHVTAKRRIALDAWPGMVEHLAPGIEGVVGSVTELEFLPDRGVDFVFASNLFEHLPQVAFKGVLEVLRRKLSPAGTLNILQPNYRYAYREYFDDYTHVAVYSHLSLADFLSANGYEVLLNAPRFLPLTVKSRLPVSPLLIRAYLASPVKVMGKQMFLRARPRPTIGARRAGANIDLDCPKRSRPNLGHP